MEVQRRNPVAATAAAGAVPTMTTPLMMGSVYVPPHKQRAFAQRQNGDNGVMQDAKRVAEEQRQRDQWHALKKTLTGLINKIHSSNILDILPRLFVLNLIRARGLFVQSLIFAQLAAPNYSATYAAVVSVINSKFPEIGELLIRRLCIQLNRGLRRNDKIRCSSTLAFIGHLFNQSCLTELLPLQIFSALLTPPPPPPASTNTKTFTSNSIDGIPRNENVELAADFMCVIGKALTAVSSTGSYGVMQNFRTLLNEGLLNHRTAMILEKLIEARKNNYKSFPSVPPECDLVEESTQIVHEISFDDDMDEEAQLNNFTYEENWQENEDAYGEIRRELLGEEVLESLENEVVEDRKPEIRDEPKRSPQTSTDRNSSKENTHTNNQAISEPPADIAITDMTEADLINLRRNIYLTVMSSLDHEECAHKLLQMPIQEGNQMEICNMIVECCSVERSYLKYYGLLGERFCRVSSVFAGLFEECFAKHYMIIHRFETNRLRNVAHFFAHLLSSDAMDWNALGFMALNEQDTTSAGRIFIKVLMQDVNETWGIAKLKSRVNDPNYADALKGLFPTDTIKHCRFAIHFYATIGLGDLTERLSEWLEKEQKRLAELAEAERVALQLKLEKEQEQQLLDMQQLVKDEIEPDASKSESESESSFHESSRSPSRSPRRSRSISRIPEPRERTGRLGTRRSRSPSISSRSSYSRSVSRSRSYSRSISPAYRRSYSRSRSRSLSPSTSRSPSPIRKRYRSTSPDHPNSSSHSRSRKRYKYSQSRSRSRSPSYDARNRTDSYTSRRSRNSRRSRISHSRSRSRSRSPSSGSCSCSSCYNRSPSRSRSRSPLPTPSYSRNLRRPRDIRSISKSPSRSPKRLRSS